ncbi:MlaA family lipoprotein [Luteimonas suaedae]|uniref:MlaA family lipoprotein n=1 Tax=Luteimonas suaedae TaxID=2605430 RepID=UPI0011EBA685|nr:MlaA family lipoprotein [Luteimonas suaedae]
MFVRSHSLLGALLALLLAGCAGTGGQVRSDPAPAGTAGAATTSAAGTDSSPASATVDTGDTPQAAAVTAPERPRSGETAADAGAPPANGNGAPTQAEVDYAAIYGEEVYDPIADPTLPDPAQMPASYDPWEPFNRRMHRFNNAIDRTIAKPLATAYLEVVPRPVRLGVRNFFHNLGQPVSALNALLQGKPKQAGHSLGRFMVNSTLGIGGIFDPASDAEIPNRSEDFGQTLGVWGWERSRYLELPLFGPRTVRDVFGMAGDAPLSPTRQLDDNHIRIFLQGLQLVDVRTQLMAVDRMREGAADEYALVRDAWMQRRQYQIHGDREGDDDELLPDYLLDDEANPTVPIDAMPVIPGTP